METGMERWLYDVQEIPWHKRTEVARMLAWYGEQGWELVALLPISDTGMSAGRTTALLATFKKRASAR